MAFSVSPGVNVSEIDLTTVIPNVSTTSGGLAGLFTWGPLNEVTLVDNELNLVKNFGKPNADSFPYFFSAANFLAYGNKLWLVRVVDEDTAKNATAEATTGSSPTSGKLYTDGTGLLIKNDEHYTNSYEGGSGDVGPWAAKYPGVLGESLKVSLCPSSAAFDGTISGTVSSSNTTLTGSSTHFLTELEVGCIIRDNAGTETRIVTAIASDTSATINSPFTSALDGATVHTRWEYADHFPAAPGTSDYASARGSSNDEMHVVVVDKDGKFTGTIGYVLEKYAFVSKAADAKKEDGTSNYYATIINRNSKYIRWMDHLASGTNWGTASIEAVTYTAVTQPRTFELEGGDDGASGVTDADYERGYAEFISAEDLDVSILIGAKASATLANWIINNVCEIRKDCVAVFSPEQADVVNNSGSEATDSISFRDSLSSSSYAIMDCNWKYQYDRYNDCYRWVPCNPDVAGLMVRTDKNFDAWWSPAGFNRGIIKNCVKLAWNPSEAQRDNLYVKGINPIVSFPGIGPCLYGDKTMLARPSAFDRINVRRLFIVLEKAISTAAKWTLFEFNDEFTRAQFRHMVEPFLREVKGRRGIYDFRVVCDTTNNTPEVIDSNQFVGDIYIKPSRSINFIQLNFVAVRTGVEFSEVVGAA